MLTRSKQLSFGSESQFRCSQLNFSNNLLQTTPLWQRITSSLQKMPLESELLIRCRRHSFGSESQFRCTTHNSAANANSLQKTQFRQRITNSLQTTQCRRRMLIRCSRRSFGSESQFRCTTHNSAANANSLQNTQFRQRITVSLHNAQFCSEC